ncbi:MAG: Deoxyguanosinetriphosphate triphosphohydrolase [Devosia sp.]|nr:Deoxyguanosinetriphosphate triphosphohydrolase [Devosia sp.]
MMPRAPYASDPANSLGRAFGTNASPTRSEFQRDRDRIIHSTAFRRLQYKTQVFLHHEGQHYRTRLTHTLEVSQMARSIARALRLNEDLAEAIALAHDLGHTPFGHAGERVLAEKMARWGSFDHNLQALRAVTLLENRYAEHDGLNLTWETLEGILKHNGPLPDATGLDTIPAAAPFRPETHASLEAQIAAIADDIAYNAHDIDDALRAGILTVDDLAAVPLVGPIVDKVRARWPDLAPNRQAHEIQRLLITRSIEDVIATTETEIADLRPTTVEDIRTAGRTLARFSPAIFEAVTALKRFLFANVYRHPTVMAPVEASERVVARLFDHYCERGDLPGRWHTAYLAAPIEAARARIVADFIAGMTDPYAMAEHARLFDAPA